MLKDVVAVRPLGDYRLHVRFDDGAEGTIDLAKVISFTGIFEPLNDRAYFSKVDVNPDVGTLCWPNGADIDPDVLYSLVTGEPIPSFAEIETVPIA